MGSVTIERRAGFYRDLFRSYSVKVNGEPKGEVKRGESIKIDLPSGSHCVKMTIDWCSSPEIVVEGNEDTVLICKPASSALMAIIDIVFRSNRYISLERGASPVVPASRRAS